jgi:ABC-2 type transport system permease protein
MLYLALNYLRVGIQNEMQYRANFFVQLVQSLISLATGLIGLWLVFSQTNELNGWTESELLVVMGNQRNHPAQYDPFARGNPTGHP